MAAIKGNWVRYSLSTILYILALNAFGGGFYAMTGAKDVPAELLEGSPFTSYFYPGLILFAVVGGSTLVSGLAVLFRHPLARKASFLSVIIVFGWLAVQLAIIGYVSWLQPMIAVTGAVILILSLRLHPH